MNPRRADPPPPAVVITGMHRSGTSLAASLVAEAGVHIGDDLMGPAPSNPRGHFEDLAFYELQQRFLAANGLSREGFTAAEAIPVPAAGRAEAQALVARRRAAGRVWGWKDPRSVLFLDFWAELLPEARFLFVVRPPSAVVDSLFRRGDDPCMLNPRLAVDLWVAYNRRIRDFVCRHPDRCAVVETAAVAADPTAFVGRLAALLAAPLASPAAQFDPGLLVTDQPDHRTIVVEALRPEARDLHAELLGLADAGPPRPAACGSVAEAALAEWARAAAATRIIASRDREAASQAQAAAASAVRLEAERTAAAALAERCAELTRSLAAATAARAAAEAALAAQAEQLSRERAGRAAERTTAAAALADAARQRDGLEDRLRDDRVAADAAAAAHADRITDLETRLAAATAAVADRDTRIAELLAGGTAAEAERIARDRAETEAAALAAQLQAERELFEALRVDLVARLEAASAGRDAAGPGSRPRSFGGRIAAEGRRLVRRVRGRRAA